MPDITIINDDFRNVMWPQCQLCLTDPPFGIGYADWDQEFNYGDFASKLSTNYLLAYTGWSTYPLHFLQVRDCGFTMREPLIVQKRPAGAVSGGFQSNADWIIFASKIPVHFRKTYLLKNKKAGAIPNKNRKPVQEYKTRFPSCWFGPEFPVSTVNPSKHVPHPCAKNVDLMVWLIQLLTDEGDLVVDPFLGSGAVAIACKLTNRKFFGCDIDPKYCSLTEDRIREVYSTRPL